MGGEVAPHGVGLGGEVAEERPPADARGVGDLVGGDLLEAARVNRSSAARSTRARVPSVGAAGVGAVCRLASRGHLCPGACLWHWVSLASASSVRDPDHPEVPCPRPTQTPRSRRPGPRRGGGPGRGVAGRGGLDRRHVRRLLSRRPPMTASPSSSTRTLPWRRARSVALRPEPFGALVYHFGNRKLSFLKSKPLVAVVEVLADHPSAAADPRRLRRARGPAPRLREGAGRPRPLADDRSPGSPP